MLQHFYNTYMFDLLRFFIFNRLTSVDLTNLDFITD